MRNLNTLPSPPSASANTDSFDFRPYEQQFTQQDSHPFGSFGQSAGYQQDPFNFSDAMYNTPTHDTNPFDARTSFPDTQVNTRPPISERLQERFGTVLEVGKRALALVNAGMFGDKMAIRAGQATQALELSQAATYGFDTIRADVQNAMENPDQLRAQAGSVIRGAAVETGKAGMNATLEYVMNHYGLEKRLNESTGEEKIRIAKKFKFGRRVVGTALNPIGKGGRLLAGAGLAARRAAKDEAWSQVTSARDAAVSYAQSAAARPAATNYPQSAFF